MSISRKRERLWGPGREAHTVTPGGLQPVPAEGELSTSILEALGYGLSRKNRSLAQANSSANIYLKQHQKFGYSKCLAVCERAQECLFGVTLECLPPEAQGGSDTEPSV